MEVSQVVAVEQGKAVWQGEVTAGSPVAAPHKSKQLFQNVCPIFTFPYQMKA